MKIFISWSKEPSKKIAIELKHFLEATLPGAAEVWMSELDIDKGKRWATEVGKQLEATNLGIICCTEVNVLEPWLHFEAGALSKSLSESLIFPICFGIDFYKLPQTLSQFQGTKYEKDDILRLIHDINVQAGNKLRSHDIDAKFTRQWEWFKTEVDKALQEARTQSVKTNSFDIKTLAMPVKQQNEIELSEIEEKIFKHVLNADHKLTAQEIGARINATTVKVEAFLSKLRSKKLIELTLSTMSKPTVYATDFGKVFALEKDWIN